LDVDGETKRTTDGAAPVISVARKWFAQNDREQDRMEIVFSEGVANQFTNVTPDDVFYIWDNVPATPTAKRQRLAKAASGSTCDNRGIVDGILNTIPGNKAVRAVGGSGSTTNTVEFFLGSGSDKLDLNTRHFINIRTYGAANPASHVKDGSENVQNVHCNRLVPITFANEPPQVARAIPNPSSPDPNKPNARPGVLNAFHDKDAAQWVRDGKGGSIVRVPVYIPGPGEGTVRCQVKVYDLVGNLVHAARSNNLVGDSNDPNMKNMEQNFMDIDLYWNGYNSKKMKVAPGTYRVIVQFDYSSSELRRRFKGRDKFTAPVGISK
jgi:hypothetical protein